MLPVYEFDGSMLTTIKAGRDTVVWRLNVLSGMKVLKQLDPQCDWDMLGLELVSKGN